MTETIIDHPGVLAKSNDADFLRELIQVAAQRLMDIEAAAVCNAGHGERTPDRENQRNGHRSRQWARRFGGTSSNFGRSTGDVSIDVTPQSGPAACIQPRRTSC